MAKNMQWELQKDRKTLIACSLSQWEFFGFVQSLLGMDHYFIIGGGGTSFVKKLFTSCCWLKKLSASREKIVCKAKGDFLKYTDISKF